RVSGEKGLGRLSAARLGEHLELITKAKNEPCWKVNLKWADLAGANSLDFCNVDITETTYEKFSHHTGTLVRITDLKTEWDEEKQEDLREQLSRLVSPFDKISDFTIWVTLPGEEAEAVEIKAPKFLDSPPYLLRGHVNEHGLLRCNYRLSTP